ncbi:Leucine Rich Repeat family protein [Histomonas meleagridis]|uniref:Leucine Rich Repeat family protein n=1 Tax=Histomonas meleagridis TaxID=135588 RepID=UPI003559F080|nr:Leucine Rich Repeat family protein [Histomonas meleagridis]KAH0796421.1 Leucine Rich Repeat family protein [Histomonas meleagridis]
MEIEKDLLDAIAPIVGMLENEKVICCVKVTHAGRKSKKAGAGMLATEFGFYVLEKGIFSKNYSIVGQFFWNSLKKIELVDNETFIFTGGATLSSHRITHHGANYLLKLIIKHIKNVLIPSEYPEFVNLDDSFTNVEHQHEAFVNRFRFQLRLLNVRKFPSELEKKLSKIICRTHTLDITALPGSDSFTDVLLDCLQIEPTIITVILPRGLKNPYWTSLANCLRRNTTLNHVVTNDPASNEIERVAEALASNQQGKLNKFTFRNANFQIEHFSILEKLFRSIPFEELEFDNSMNGPIFQQLLLSESMGLALTSLQSLILKKTRELNLEIIFQMLPSLKRISLIECDINIGKICHLMSKLRLESIEIKGGYAQNSIQVSKIPPQLSSFTFEDITWEGQSFTIVWNAIMTHQPTSKKLTVSLSSARIKTEHWSQFYREVQNTPPCQYLTSLTWSENEVQAPLFQYLLSCPQLNTIVFNGCFSSNSSSIIGVLTEFLNAKPSIESVTIKGTKRAQLGDSAPILFSRLKKNQNLKYLDVSNNDFGSQGLLSLGEFLVANKKLREIVFANNNIETGEAYETFFDTVMNRGPKLVMEWPDKEITDMHKAKLLKGKSVNHMMDCYAIIINGNLKAKVTDDATDDASNLFNEGPKMRHSGSRSRSPSIGHKHHRSKHRSRTSSLVNEDRPLASDKSSSSFDPLQISEGSETNQDQWKFTLPEIPVPDINEQVKAIDAAYNINVLLKRMRQV